MRNKEIAYKIQGYQHEGSIMETQKFTENMLYK